MADVVKVTINADDCISCEACVSACEDVFEMADDKAIVKGEAQDPAFLKPRSADVIAAAEGCPSEAIKCETA